MVTFCVLLYLLVGFILTTVVDKYTDFFDGAPEVIRGVCVIVWIMMLPFLVLFLLDILVKKLSGK